jgi:hypothetical protein
MQQISGQENLDLSAPVVMIELEIE